MGSHSVTMLDQSVYLVGYFALNFMGSAEYTPLSGSVIQIMLVEKYSPVMH
jgi:hypothetical protein